jgi:hypothetical protein
MHGTVRTSMQNHQNLTSGSVLESVEYDAPIFTDNNMLTTSFVTIADPFLLSSTKFYEVLLSYTELKTFNPTRST